MAIVFRDQDESSVNHKNHSIIKAEFQLVSAFSEANLEFLKRNRLTFASAKHQKYRVAISGTFKSIFNLMT